MKINRAIFVKTTTITSYPLFSVSGKRKLRTKRGETTSSSSTISTAKMNLIIEKLECQRNRSSTNRNYYNIWRKFNDFVFKLDAKPKSWEERTSLYGAYLVDQGVQSSTLKSYVSAIKCVLVTDGLQMER